MNKYNEKIIERWKHVLDAGNPPYDREYCAITLERIETGIKDSFKNRGINSKRDKILIFLIPMIRRILCFNVQIDFNENFKTEENVMHWDKDLETHMFDVNSIDVNTMFEEKNPILKGSEKYNGKTLKLGIPEFITTSVRTTLHLNAEIFENKQ